MLDPDVERVLGHRLRAHIAALTMATQLGNPAILAAQVRETKTRLAEVRAIINELQDEQ